MRYKLLITSIFFALVSTITVNAQNDLHSDLKKLEFFLASVDSKYVDSVNTSELVETALKEMLRELDPHSVYLDRESYSSSNEQLQGKFKGIGIRYQMIDDTMTVLEVMPNSGASRAGMKMGDQIIATASDTISGKLLANHQIGEILQTENDQINDLVVWRKVTEQKLIFNIDRTQIDVSSVPVSVMIGNESGYIKLSKFTASSYDDFKEALEELNDQGVKQLIVDLRGNSGGYLSRAIKITDEFLDDRKLIVFTEGLHQAKKETFATSGGRYLKGDLIILIDENSASASEIFAGAIQDWDRGLIIGRRSFGKGLVQRPIEFNDGSAMRLTISRYYTPTGRSIQQPYQDGYEAYKKSHRLRNISGELLSQDSIKVADSLIYYTPNNRKVYGGGGIVPDVFVAKDTSSLSYPIRPLNRRGLIHGYALKLASEQGDSIRRNFSTVNAFLQSEEINTDYTSSFNEFVEGRALQLDTVAFKANKTEFEEQLIPLICRFVYDYESYFRALLNYDKDFLAALEAFEKDTIQELGLK